MRLSKSHLSVSKTYVLNPLMDREALHRAVLMKSVKAVKTSVRS